MIAMGEGKEFLLKKRLMTFLATGAFVGAMMAGGAGSALAGEVKGPPTGGDPNTNYNLAATTHANSECAFSGLNDYQQGQKDKRTQTPADAPPGIPGLACRGGSNPDRGGE
jgi:hypothetical protein